MLTDRPPIDLLSTDYHGEATRAGYAWMRAHEPVYFDAANGLWGIASYDALLAAERDAQTFSNAGGTRPDTGPLPWLIDMDAPAHMTRRRLVGQGFTPPRVRASEPKIRQICDELLDGVLERGECDFVHDIAAMLPMIVIGDMLGVRPEDRPRLMRWSDALLGSLGGPEHIMAAAEAFVEWNDYARAVIEARRAEPTDDLVSALVHATVDGDRLSDDEVVMEALLVLVGGNETTRHVLAEGMYQLMHEPEAAAALRADPALWPGAVEEILRWVSPVKNMTRTVTRDVEFFGAQLRAGDKALLLYESADFDEAHFDHPERFDIRRAPNDHVAFGSGPHFCMGASLARVELHAMLEGVLTRLADIELATDEPLSRGVSGLDRLPIRFRAA